jgi:preprotein translocase subunit SecA
VDGPAVHGLGLTVGAIQSDMPVGSPEGLRLRHHVRNQQRVRFRLPPRQHASGRSGRRPVSQGVCSSPRVRWRYAIVDEVDNILIDEARTPLIISGPATTTCGKYAEAIAIARQLKKDLHFIVNEKDHTANLTDEGVREAERWPASRASTRRGTWSGRT